MRADVIKRATGQVFVNSNGVWMPNGACFRLPALLPESEDAVIYATAYHAIRECQAWKEAIAISHRREELIPAQLIAVDESSDLALLGVYNAGAAWALPCARDLRGGEVAILGYPKVFTHQAFTRAEWREVLPPSGETGSPVISVFSPEIASSAPSLIPLPTPHAQWRGLSGGPCILLKPSDSEDYEYAIGLVTNTSPDGIAGRLYCAPIDAIEQLCNTKGIILDLTEPARRDSQLSEALMGETLRHLADPQRERHAWITVSNLFFQDTDIIRELHSVIRSPSQYKITEEDIPFLYYFLGRLQLKKGSPKLANQHFQEAVLSTQKIDPVAARRLRALIAARRAAEHPITGAWQQQIRRLREVSGALEDLPDVPDSYKYIELASLLGWQCTKFFQKADKLPADAKAQLLALTRQHRSMLSQLRDERPNQEVVSTALEVLALLWNQGTSFVEDLHHLVRKGFAQARARRNSIFCIQMMLVRAIAFWIEGKRMAAFSTIITASELLRSQSLTLDHEGVAQIFTKMQADLAALALTMTNCLRLRSAMWRDRIDSLTAAGLERSVALETSSNAQAVLNDIRNNYKQTFEIDPEIFEQWAS